MKNKALEFLKSKNVVTPSGKDLVIKGSFGTVSLLDLLTEFQEQNQLEITFNIKHLIKEVNIIEVKENAKRQEEYLLELLSQIQFTP